MKKTILGLVFACGAFGQTTEPAINANALMSNGPADINAAIDQLYKQPGQQVTSLPATCSRQYQMVDLIANGTSSRYLNTASGATCTWVQVQQAMNASSLMFGREIGNARAVRLFGAGLATGDNQIGSAVPDGSRMLVTGCGIYNGSGGSVDWYPEIKVSSTWYRLGSAATVLSGANGFLNGHAIILDAGEAIGINTATTAGANGFCNGVLFSSSSPFRSVKLTGPSTGNNTLYTNATTNGALVLGNASSYSLGNNVAIVAFVADAGGARTFGLYLVPSGGAAGTSNLARSVSVNASTLSSAVLGLSTLTAGDSLVVSVDTGAAGEFVWANILELP